MAIIKLNGYQVFKKKSKIRNKRNFQIGNKRLKVEVKKSKLENYRENQNFYENLNPQSLPENLSDESFSDFQFDPNLLKGLNNLLS